MFHFQVPGFSLRFKIVNVQHKAVYTYILDQDLNAQYFKVGTIKLIFSLTAQSA